VKKALSNKFTIAFFMLPAFIIFTVFVIYPIIPEIKMSLYDFNGITYKKFVGLGNYKATLTDPRFWSACLNSFKVVVIGVGFGVPCEILLALILDRVITPTSKKIYKLCAFFPAVLSVTVISQLWLAMYDNDWGLINSLLRSIGLENLTQLWLGNSNLAIWSIGFAFVWQYLGINSMIIYSGIKTIPESYFEAAKLDGASFWQTSFKITIPLLTEIIKYIVVVSFLGSIGEFARIKIMTKGGPGISTRTIIYQLYQKTFADSNFGEGCAIGIVFLLLCSTIVITINYFVSKKEGVEF
jgi:ABC-type sugar transport system permease subunit